LNPGKVTIFSQRLEHNGACGNFFRLIHDVPHSYKYYAFCDQDDVWFEDKLARSVEILRDSYRENVLVVCDCCIIDKDMELERNSFVHEITGTDPHKAKLHNIIAHNWALGAAMLFTKSMLDLISKTEDTKELVMYDYWIIILATTLGRIEFLDDVLYCYRQHERNYVGATKIKINVIPHKAKLACKELRKKERQANYFLEVYGDDLSDAHRSLLKGFANIKRLTKFQRIKWLQTNNIVMGDFLSQIGLIVFI
jgi:rhamnosyltransferase